MSATRAKYPYGPNRFFVYAVGVAVAAQIWMALPRSPVASNTAELERAVYGELQAEWPVGDVRCATVSQDAATCVAALPNMVRARVSARMDARSGEITSVVIESVLPDRVGRSTTASPIRPRSRAR